MKKVLIIGSSAAGISAAKAARKTDPDCEIIVFTKDTHLPYYRPYLTEYIGDSSVENRSNFYLNSREWYKENRIELLKSTEITEIIPSGNRVKDSNGKNYNYDSLILATGAFPFVPVPRFLEHDFVFTVRSFDDAVKVHEYASKIKKAVVIGGGLLGLEAAWSLSRENVEVAVLELSERLLPKQLDADASSFMGSVISKHNVNVVTSAMTDDIMVENGKKSVVLKDGSKIETDMVIISIGVKANDILAKNCGIDTDRGIVVNSRMETSAQNIFACGDVAQFDSATPLWMPAIKQGSVAGTNAAGGNDEFAADIYPATLKAFETTLFSIGNIKKEPEIEELSKIDDDKYLKLFYKNKKLDGAVLINDPSKISAVLNAVKKGLSQKETADLAQ